MGHARALLAVDGARQIQLGHRIVASGLSACARPRPLSSRPGRGRAGEPRPDGAQSRSRHRAARGRAVRRARRGGPGLRPMPRAEASSSSSSRASTTSTASSNACGASGRLEACVHAQRVSGFDPACSAPVKSQGSTGSEAVPGISSAVPGVLPGRAAAARPAWRRGRRQAGASAMFRVVVLQIVATLVVSLLAALGSGQAAAVSALLGGAACFVPNGLFALQLAAAARSGRGADSARVF